MIDMLALRYFVENLRHFVAAFRYGQHGNRFAEGLLGCVSEDTLRAFIPTGNDAPKASECSLMHTIVIRYGRRV